MVAENFAHTNNSLMAQSLDNCRNSHLGPRDAGNVVEGDAAAVGVLQLDALELALGLAQADSHLLLVLLPPRRLLHLHRAQPPEVLRLLHLARFVPRRLGRLERLPLLRLLRMYRPWDDVSG